MKKVIMILVILIASISTAQADCTCTCVNNQKQQVCTNTWDVPMGYCGGYCW